MTPPWSNVTVDRIPAVPLARRRELAATTDRSPAVHQQAFDELDVLALVESVGEPSRPSPATELRVVAANLERGIRFGEMVDLLAETGADVFLLSELDDGMARSGQRHVARDVAEALRGTYAYAVEFVELRVDDGENERGFHGGAIVSRVPMERPAVVRLSLDGAWFDGQRPGAEGEPRVGSRIAVMATVEVGRRPVTVVAPHLESHGSPDQRGQEMADVIEAVDAYSPGSGVVIGGDLNTHTIGPAEFGGAGAMAAALADGAARFLDPVAREPLFDVAAAAGFDWRAANDLSTPTARVSHELPPSMHLDWFLTRDLVATDPAVVPAVAPDGVVASDHDLIAVTVEST